MGKIFIIIMISFCIFSVPIFGKTLTITVVSGDNSITRAGKSIIFEAYRRIGIKVNYLNLPGERALIMTNTGHTDGELLRVDGMSSKYPNLIKVPIVYLLAEQTAFSKNRKLKVAGWKSLKPYRIGFRIGYKLAEFKTIGMDVDKTSTAESAFEMLERDRVDVVVENRQIGLEVVRSLNLKGITPISPPIQVDPLFHYLHKKHDSLVSALTVELSEMKRKGILQKHLDRENISFDRKIMVLMRD